MSVTEPGPTPPKRSKPSSDETEERSKEESPVSSRIPLRRQLSRKYSYREKSPKYDTIEDNVSRADFALQSRQNYFVEPPDEETQKLLNELEDNLRSKISNSGKSPSQITAGEFKSILDAVRQSSEFQECLQKIDLPKLQGLKDTSD